jgi:hypothetical protein
LGKYVEVEGSQKAGIPEFDDETVAAVGKALRVAWCWRKVHAVYTLASGGYPAVFVDASAVALSDLRASVAEGLAFADLVTLSDFGGPKEQETLNTGVLAAAPDGFSVTLASPTRFGVSRGSRRRWRRSIRALEEWMSLEPAAVDTEQAYLTWDLAPKARARGDIIFALPHANFPSFVTFNETRHASKRNATAAAPRLAGGSLGAGAGAGASASEGAVLVHAAYCGSVSGKLAFLRRVAAIARDPARGAAPTRDEISGCDQHDKEKYRRCGRAPWEGDDCR